MSEALQKVSRLLCKDCLNGDYLVCSRCEVHKLVNEVLEELR